jgi:hypothetical protein
MMRYTKLSLLFMVHLYLWCARLEFPSFLVIKFSRSSLCSLNELYVVCQVSSITSFFTSYQCFFNVVAFIWRCVT